MKLAVTDCNSSFVMIYLTNAVGLNPGIVGTAIAGWLLAFSGFDGTSATQSTGCINMMYFMYLWLPFVIDLLITVILSRINVEKVNEKLREQNQIKACAWEEV